MTKGIFKASDVVKEVFERIQKEKNLSREAIQCIWKDLVGEKGFIHSRPTAIRKKILTVKVDNSGWLEDLVFKRRGILKGLKKVLGRNKISEIRFKIGEVDGKK